MTELSVKHKEFTHENQLYESFLSSNDLSVIKSMKSNENSWFMAFGRYLKTQHDHPSDLLYEFLREILNENLPITRSLFLILKQCVYLYPEQLVNLSFQRHLNNSLLNLTNGYLRYKYVRLLRLILDEIKPKSLDQVLPSINLLIENYSQFDPSIILVLEKFVLIKLDNQLQFKLNSIYKQNLVDYLQSNDFDDDEIIDLFYLLFQINLHESIECFVNNYQLILNLFEYINYDTDTMMNWLLTPETGEKFLIFILRLMKHLSTRQTELKVQCQTKEFYETIKQFHHQLRTASDKSLFPYNIKPLLNIFNLF